MDYDIIVIGAGHAGSEAAAAGANLGSNVLLITMDMTKIAQMSCNPAMGGIAKGQIIREIDALGGYSGMVTDESMIQFRMLNKSKGPAMWSPRAQCDRMMFSMIWRNKLESIYGVDFWQDMVVSLIIDNDSVIGVRTKLGKEFYGKSVILTSGTFLNGVIHVGRKTIGGGRISEEASTGISEQLETYDFKIGRMKTGTPARLDGRTIDFKELAEQKGDEQITGFSYFFDKEARTIKQRSCYIAYTSEDVHRELERGFKDSPLYNGTIRSIGPRYCPSIEDKIVTFAEKDKHQLFLEPEGMDTIEYYINGFSSSLPLEVQYNALRKIKGLENVKIFRPGYAIEYDYYDPTQLYHTLETRSIKNLYFAGQVNGTTGYEEAAAQGLMAAINAHQKINGKEKFILNRDEAYIGVLIDDLVNKGVDEPYRMFTSRAEYRVLLRQDNADLRLTEKSFNIGLAKIDRFERMKKRKGIIDDLYKVIYELSVEPGQINDYLVKSGTSEIKQKVKLINIINRPQVKLEEIFNRFNEIADHIERIKGFNKRDIIDFTETEIKYVGYINREKSLADKLKRLKNIKLRKDFEYSELKSLSTEARQKLSRIQPDNIEEASRISGISPSDINVLLVHLGR